MNKSESIKNIAKALAAFQSEVKNPANTADNPYFKSKYAPLQDILKEVRPLLSKHGLSLLQTPSGDGEKIIITTLLMHESGEWIESCPLVLKADKPTAQGAGSCITYGRRYSLSAILGISSEDDDDGNHASQPAKTPNTTPRPKGEKISEPQVNKIHALLKEVGIDENTYKGNLKKNYKVESTKDLTKQQASKMIENLERIKSQKEAS